jgi:hypothetical protein
VANTLWEHTRDDYAFIARRDADMLNASYPATMPVIRLRLRRAGVDIGWAVVRRREVSEDGSGPFGRLRVGLIADALAAPPELGGALAAADRFLSTRGVDLIVSNQTHGACGNAFRALGYLSAPSQFAFYCSPKMSELLKEADRWSTST